MFTRLVKVDFLFITIKILITNQISKTSLIFFTIIAQFRPESTGEENLLRFAARLFSFCFYPLTEVNGKG
jgi:hypothetical protein